MMSACIKWAKEHLDDFNVILVRQLSSVEAGSTVWQECMDMVQEHAVMLNEVGLDFRNLIGNGLEMKDVSSKPATDGSVGLGLR